MLRPSLKSANITFIQYLLGSHLPASLLQPANPTYPTYPVMFVQYVYIQGLQGLEGGPTELTGEPEQLANFLKFHYLSFFHDHLS